MSRRQSKRLRPKPRGAASRARTVVVCRCEEITEAEIRSVIKQGYHTLEEIKRILRTGMGHCQGRGCLRIIARMVQEETGMPAASQKLPTARPPLKPLSIGLLGRPSSE